MQIENEYRQSLEEIDHHFEQKKKELMDANRQELEREKEKWE